MNVDPWDVIAATEGLIVRWTNFLKRLDGFLPLGSRAVDRRVQILIGFAAILAVAVVAVVIGQSGGDDDKGSSSASSGGKPEVNVPDGPPPKELQVQDLEQGDGAEAKAGDNVSVQYVGVLYDGGKEFDSSYDTGQPFQFQLGSGQVIPGWDQGVAGMKVGGRRQLTIPPDLAYGAQGQPPDIPANATLVFVIDLVSVN
jgi:peptidylprolyl isomerase